MGDRPSMLVPCVIQVTVCEVCLLIFPKYYRSEIIFKIMLVIVDNLSGRPIIRIRITKQYTLNVHMYVRINLVPRETLR